MEKTEIKDKVKIIIAGMFDINPEDVPEYKPFPEMAKYDSMRALEFLAKLETEFNIMIDPDYLYKMQTIEKSVEIIEEILRG